ncbi:hypothetical protein A11A3_02697 [Alcanivorax hongdengensis A-11-3]|uniref:Permuted papain-like amidase YaeF/Yiix C92 family enzyme n=1 Tax=Alcanivorax hongdengensis A-11-3 TaxID=1177179 RepID=L0WHV3_9GAMM|nr:hypothetical protein A11A3_02697 [Alcanivorax hongdengensis A-11-3]
MIRVFTRSRWSHVGMVVCLPEQAEPLVLESTTLGESRDIMLGRPVPGVSLVPLSDKIREYPGEVALRRRHGPDLDSYQQRLLARMVQRLLHRPYKNYLLCNALDVLTGFSRRPDQRGWFCSELVAELYRRLGWLPPDIRPSVFVPGHFGSRRMRLVAGKLGPLAILKGEPTLTTTSALPANSNPATDCQTAAHGTLLPLQ